MTQSRTPRQPPGDVAPVVQRIRLRFTKRHRLRFTSHRDIQRALERAIRRSSVPIAYSAGFSPHPKISWAGAVPTGAASEAEYVEIGLAEWRDPALVAEQLDAALPVGIDVIAASDDTTVPLATALAASQWQVLIEGVSAGAVTDAVGAFLAATDISIRRMTKSGERDVEVRAHVLAAATDVLPDSELVTLNLVIETAVPTVRPDDVLAALVQGGMPEPVAPAVSTRLAYGSWDGQTVTSLF